MMLSHFKLREQPFGVSPDPRYLYSSSTHREALASIVYGIESGLGFITLTGMPGTGKTTLLFEVMRRFEKSAKIVFLVQTISSPADLLRAILLDLGVTEVKPHLADMQLQLNRVLISQASTGRRFLLVVDEAQNLSDSVLEAVRMLSNFETASQKLMQIVLAGQLQLAERLALPQLLQLRQRISIFAHLKSLSLIETRAYINHRIEIAGYHSDNPIFENPALALIYGHSGGVPRNINTLCFHAMSLAYARDCTTVGSDLIKAVIDDLDLTHHNELQPDPYPELASRLPDKVKRIFGRGTKWSPRRYSEIAAVCCFLLLFCWLLLHQYWVKTKVSSVFASPQDTYKAVEHKTVEQRPTGRPVIVQQGETIYQICKREFGVCRPEMLRDIMEINSDVHDPSEIQIGQRIFLPTHADGAIANKESSMAPAAASSQEGIRQ